jgi:hypothetical protein
MKNCFTYALEKWISEGGYLLIRKSHLSDEFNLTKWNPLYWVPHFLHRSKDKVITQYSITEEQRVIDRQKGPLYAFLHLWNLKGHTIGDD